MDIDTQDPQGIQAQADRWFARLLGPGIPEAEREAFERWRRVPEHAAAYARSEYLWNHFGMPEIAADPRVVAMRRRLQAPAVGATADWHPNRGRSPFRQRRASARPWWRKWPGAVAAGAVCAIAWLGFGSFDASSREMIYVATDEPREVRLEDGSHVQLDVDTELVVDFDRARRAAVLRHGRAFFEVAHAPARPFSVDLGASEVTVLGTRFQAARNSEEVAVVLEQGSLRMDEVAGTFSRDERLVAGDEVSYAVRNPSVWHKRRVDTIAATAWTRGRLIFRTTPLVEAVREVNRYANPKIRLGDPALEKLAVSGNFIAGDSELVADTWAATMSLRVEKRTHEIVLQPL